MPPPPLRYRLCFHLCVAEYNLYSATVYNFGGAFVPNTCVRRGDQALGMVYDLGWEHQRRVFCIRKTILITIRKGNCLDRKSKFVGCQ